MLDIENPRLALVHCLALQIWPDLDGEAEWYVATAPDAGPLYCPQCFQYNDEQHELVARPVDGFDAVLECPHCGKVFKIPMDEA